MHDANILPLNGLSLVVKNLAGRIVESFAFSYGHDKLKQAAKFTYLLDIIREWDVIGFEAVEPLRRTV